MYRPSLSLITTFASASLLTLFACSGSSKNSGFDPNDPNGTSSGSSGASGTSGILGSSGASGTSGSSGAGCNPNPANAEIPGNNCDDDGDGQVDNVETCDSAATSGSETDFAKTMGICDDASSKGYGLVSATFTNGFTSTKAPDAKQHNTLGQFGSVLKPREGSLLGVLSTGYAGEFDSKTGAGGTPFIPGQEWLTNGDAPPGYPKATAAGCDSASDVHDVANIHLQLKAPPNATGFQFDFNFHSGEWPAYICSPFNDSFIAFLSAAGFNGGTAENMSFDSMNNPVSVNNGFFDRCTPNTETGCESGSSKLAACAGGTSELGGTGFGITQDWCPGQNTVGGGATGWLTSKAAVNPGETFTLDLMVWDTGDSRLDSLVLLDNFQWIGGAPVVTSTDRPK